MRSAKTLVVLIFMVLRWSGCDAQSKSTADPAPWTYDVVAIKLETANPGAVGFRKLPTGFEAYSVSLRDLIAEAYRSPDASLVLNAPDWRARYHVVAKMDPEQVERLSALPPEERSERQSEMLKALLAQYFNLQVHSGTRPLSIYSLVIDKKGLKLKHVESSGAGQGSDKRGDGVASFVGDGRLVGQFSMSRLAHLLTVAHSLHMDSSDRPVIDQTGLSGEYIVNLTWVTLSKSQGSRGDRNSEVYTSLQSALQEQAGLRLVPDKIQATSIVVDHADRPTLD